MKKILLTGINARFSHSNPSLYYLRTFIHDLDFDVEIVELTINQDRTKLIDAITGKGADIIALSVYIWNVELIKEILPQIFTRSGKAEIVLGGPEVSYNPEEWLDRYGFIGHIITGHGETGFRELLTGKNTGRIIKSLNPHFSEIPFPYRKEDFSGFRQRNIYYESSRGCPFRCSYCVSSHYEQKLEYRPLEKVRNELDIIISHKPRIVKFVDRTFNSKKPHYREIWKHIVQSYSAELTLFHFEIYPHLLDEDDFTFLADVPPGLFQFEAGIQSVSSPTLEAINRRETWDRIKPKLEKLISMKNIHLHVDLIIGLPFEDSLKMRESFNQVYSLKADHFQMGLLKVLKGTEIMERTGEYGIEYSPGAPYRIESTKWLTAGEVGKLLDISLLIDTLYNRHRFDTTLENLADRCESPYHLYDKLSGYINSTYEEKRSRKWEVNADRILGFIESEFPEKSDFFRDCLMYDWCMTTRLNYYPALFRNEKTKKVKKKGFRFFTDTFPRNEIDYQGVKFTRSEMKRSIFFSPETAEFREKYMNHHTALLFLKDSGEKVFFTI
jgi:radical SAM superfamily enzyme YgiQ (UPF0313 family)